MYSLHQQYLDLASGFHVIELRDERGNLHLVLLAVGHNACPACGGGCGRRDSRQQLPRDLSVNRPAVWLREHPVDGLPYQIMREIEPGLRGGGKDAPTLQFGQAR